MKSDRVQATTWLSLHGLFRQGFKFLICLVAGTLPCASPASSTALSIASYLYGTNSHLDLWLAWGISVPDGTCEIDVAGLVVAWYSYFYFVVNFLAQVR